MLPVLPSGGFGPFGFFAPRKIWLFVVMICDVSFVGYFLTKFLHPTRGMTAVGLVCAWLLGRAGAAAHQASAGFANPFSLGPALRLGAVFTIVLFVTRAARQYLGNGGVLASGALSGLVDVDALTLSLAGFVDGGDPPGRDMALALVLAAATNHVVKSGLAITSRQSAFWARVTGGLLASVLVAIAVALLPR